MSETYRAVTTDLREPVVSWRTLYMRSKSGSLVPITRTAIDNRIPFRLRFGSQKP